MSALAFGPSPADADPHAITAQLRASVAALAEHLESLSELMGQAYLIRADKALDYPSWDAYCADIFTAVRSARVNAQTRQALVLALRESSLSVRAISAALGISKNTVTTDLKGSGAGGATVISLDGRRRPAAAAFSVNGVSKRPLTVRVAEAVGQTEDGMTVSEVARMFRIHHGQASGTLSRLEKRGLLTRLGIQRGGRGIYVSSPAPGGSSDA